MFDHSAISRPDGSRLDQQARRIAVLTGQANPADTTLSPERIRFLHHVAPTGFVVLPHGFPYHAACESGGHRDTALLIASLRIARQFVAASYAGDFRALLETRLAALFATTSDDLVLLTGSSGLHLLNCAWPAITTVPRRYHVLALGPACPGPLRIPCDALTTIRGHRDGWSRMLFRGAIDHEIAADHLGYWSSREVVDLVRALVADRGYRA